MRIVHVVLSLGIGGQERLILNLSRALGRRGHEVTVVSLTPGGDLRSEFDSIAVLDVERTARVSPRVFLELGKAFRALRPDVVHTHNQAPLFYAAPTARALGVRRVIHTKHGAGVYSTKAGAFARLTVQTLSAFVAVSQETADVARSMERVPERLLRVIPNGIPLERFHPDADARRRVREAHGIPEHAFVVGTVGRLVWEKNYPLLVRAMIPLLSSDVRLVIVGEGPERGAIEGAIPKELAPFVTLTGVRRDVAEQLAAMDVFTLSSVTEGLPLVVAEAMACGLPVVVTRVGALASIVPSEVGVVVGSGDESGLTQAYRQMRDDPERRVRLGGAAVGLAQKRFSIERMTEAYLELYRN
jgi:glycosyltransferase involved in cell wall biosynthesis